MSPISAQDGDSVEFLLREEGLEHYRMRLTAPRGTQVRRAPSPDLDPMNGPAAAPSPTFLTCPVLSF